MNVKVATAIRPYVMYMSLLGVPQLQIDHGRVKRPQWYWSAYGFVLVGAAFFLTFSTFILKYYFFYPRLVVMVAIMDLLESYCLPYFVFVQVFMPIFLNKFKLKRVLDIYEHVDMTFHTQYFRRVNFWIGIYACALSAFMECAWIVYAWIHFQLSTQATGFLFTISQMFRIVFILHLIPNVFYFVTLLIFDYFRFRKLNESIHERVMTCYGNTLTNTPVPRAIVNDLKKYQRLHEKLVTATELLNDCFFYVVLFLYFMLMPLCIWAVNLFVFQTFDDNLPSYSEQAVQNYALSVVVSIFMIYVAISSIIIACEMVRQEGMKVLTYVNDCRSKLIVINDTLVLKFLPELSEYTRFLDQRAITFSTGFFHVRPASAFQAASVIVMYVVIVLQVEGLLS